MSEFPRVPRGASFDRTAQTVQVVEVPSKGALFLKRFLRVLLLLLGCYGIYSGLEVISLKGKLADSSATISSLKEKLKGQEGLQAENARLTKDLQVEVARKNKLAVENTALLGRVTQGQADLKIVGDKLKACQAPTKKK